MAPIAYLAVMSRRPTDSLFSGPVKDASPAAASNLKTRRSMGRFMLYGAGLQAAFIDRLWEEPDEVLASGRLLKDGDRCTVAQVVDADPSEPTPLVLKRYNLKDRVHTAAHAVLRSRARWGWVNGHRLASAGLPTPVPRACLEELRYGTLRLRSYLLTSFVPGRTLLELIASGEADPAQLADLARQFSRIWQALGQMRAGHGDMKATNFIVDPQWRLWLIDLDGLRIYRSSILLRRERRLDLARFMRNWQERPEVAAVFRARIGTG